MPYAKRLRPAALFAAVLLLCAPAAMAADEQGAGAAGPPFVTVNGQHLASTANAPLLSAGTILLEVNDLFAAIGGQVTSSGDGSTITVDRAGIRLQMTVDTPSFTIGDQRGQFFIAPLKLRNAVYVDVNTLLGAFGGQLGWDSGTLTADLAIEVPGAEVRVVRGTLVQLYQGPPLMFVVRPLDGGQPVGHQGMDGLKLFRLDAAGAPQATDLDGIKVGDSVELGLDAQDKVVRCLAGSLEAAGVMESLGGGEIVLQDGSRYPLAPDVKATTKDGAAYNLGYLRRGDKVTLALGAEDRAVTALVVDVTGVGERVQEETPQIFVLSTRARRPVREGQSIWMQMLGTPGGKATVDIGDSIKGIQLPEGGNTGVYGLVYRVRPGENAINAPLTGHLEVNGRQAEPAVASHTVTVDTTAPTFLGVSPANLANIETASPTIQATYADANGSGVDPKSVKITLDGTDVTAAATITAASASYEATGLAAGNHTIGFEIADMAGNTAKLDSAFTLRVATANIIRSVKHDAAAPLMTGAMLTVLMEVAQTGKSAYFTIGDRAERIAMQPIAVANTYRGQYQVTAQDRATGVTITGFFVGNDNRVHSMAATTTVDFNPLPQGLTVTTPQEDGRVASAKFAVEGLAPPGSKVRVAITYELFGRHTLDSDTATTDANGVWKTRDLDLTRNLAAMLVSKYTLTAELLGDNDRVVETKQFTITSAGG